MKTRVVHTRFWEDGFVSDLTPEHKLLFLYVLTNSRANICGVYELPDKRILYDLGITADQLKEGKEHLSFHGKVIFLNGWVRIVNSGKYQNYTGSKNEVACASEIDMAPKQIMEYPIDTLYVEEEYPIDTQGIALVISNKKSEISKEIGESEREEEMKSFWKQHRNSSIRKDIPGNINAYEYLKKEFGETLPAILLAARMIQDDNFQNRGFQAKMTNFIGIREKIEQVEAYMVAKMDGDVANKTRMSVYD